MCHAVMRSAVFYAWVGLLVVSLVSVPLRTAQAVDTPLTLAATPRDTIAGRVLAAFQSAPLYFVPNLGQVGAWDGYYAWAGGQNLVFTAEGLSLVAGETRWEIHFAGAQSGAEPTGVTRAAAQFNYFIGSDPTGWRTNVPAYEGVVYYGLYPGIDLSFAGHDGTLKYTFIVGPGADPEAIRLSYDHPASIRLEATGDMTIALPWGALRDTKPTAYQDIGGQRVAVDVAFQLDGQQTYGFTVRSDYDQRYPLVIDPAILYSTFLGGRETDAALDVAVDSSGKAYISGRTESIAFPLKSAFDPSHNGGKDAFVSKIDITETGEASLIYSTYLGGSQEDVGNGVAVDGSGQACVVGWTYSTYYPTTVNAFDQVHNGGIDAFVTRLNAAGNALLYSTFVGGAPEGGVGGDDYGYDVALDSANCIYLVGQTSSDYETFPLTNESMLLRGPNDAFAAKLDPSQSGDASLVYSTYLGGDGGESGWGVAVDSYNQAHVVGDTSSNNFDTTGHAYDRFYNGGASDVFLTKLNTTANDLLYSTYLGGSGDDHGRGVALDSSGRAYLTGSVGSTNFPTRSYWDNSLGGAFDAFVAKIDPALNDDASLIYSTYLGGSGDEWGTAIAVNGNGHAFVTGWTPSSDFPVENASLALQLDGGIQPQGGSGGDAYVTHFNAAGNDLICSTFLGGDASDGGAGIAVRGAATAYIVGHTSSNDFVTKNAYQPARAGVTGTFDAFLTAYLFGPILYCPITTKE